MLNFVLSAHRILGEMILPPLIVAAALWFTLTWRPDAPPDLPARLFPALVDIEVTLGLIAWGYLFWLGAPMLTRFPLMAHPLLGLLAIAAAHLAVSRRSPLRRLGRWSPLVALALLLLIVLGAIASARIN